MAIRLGLTKGWSILPCEPSDYPRSILGEPFEKTLPRTFRFNLDGNLAYAVELWEDFLAVVFPHVRQIAVPLKTRDRSALSTLISEQVLPRALAHGGHLVLHASTVQVGEAAILFLAPTGSGKSTLGASFDLAGYDLLGDDAALMECIGDKFCVEVLQASLRLRTDSLQSLFGVKATLDPDRPVSGKHRVTLPEANRREASRIPVKALFFLTGRSSCKEVRLQRLASADACMAVIENSFSLDPEDRSLAQEKLLLSSRIASSLPCIQLSVPNDFMLLGEVHKAVLQELEELSTHGV